MEESHKVESCRKVILKVAQITEAEKHPNGDRLYILT